MEIKVNLDKPADPPKIVSEQAKNETRAAIEAAKAKKAKPPVKEEKEGKPAVKSEKKSESKPAAKAPAKPEVKAKVPEKKDKPAAKPTAKAAPKAPPKPEKKEKREAAPKPYEAITPQGRRKVFTRPLNKLWKHLKKFASSKGINDCVALDLVLEAGLTKLKAM